MQAQKKHFPNSDQTSKIREGRRGRKAHEPREDDKTKASVSTVQPPIQRPDGGSEVPAQSTEPTPPEADDPEPKSSTLVTPIQRPDDDQ